MAHISMPYVVTALQRQSISAAVAAAVAAPSVAPVDGFAPSVQAAPVAYTPAMVARTEVRQALQRMMVGEVSPEHMDIMVDGLAVYGSSLLNRLADNGLTIVVPQEGFAHYSADSRRITFPRRDLDQDTDVPFREYMLVHEMAHALDYLYEPALGPLSERSDLGIAAHRTRLNSLYQPVLARYRQLEAQHRRAGTWRPAPPAPTTRVYGEDFMTVVERVTGQRIAERPARGHISILEPNTKPTEYFADAVYTYLHRESTRTYNYTLPNGQPIAHAYPAQRADQAVRDPRMHDALGRFFADPAHPASALTITDSRR